jgi:plasmid stabilization system protein ParE
MPLLFAESYRGIRRVPVRRFPYVVYYRVEGDDTVVLAVLHGRRHPREWKKRS